MSQPHQTTKPNLPFFISIPHSGERIPPEASWLKGLPEPLLFQDVDRYVDILYGPALKDLALPFIKTEWHRYAADLNRIPEDIDQDSVIGAPLPAGTHPRGFHWVMTTHRERLMPKPMSKEDHQKLVELIYKPFHAQIAEQFRYWKSKDFKKVFHLDAHSMPSVGTSEHRDPGERRADVVISDSKGKSCDPAFKDLVIAAYEKQGFKIAYNWPYYGGRVTEQYGKPELGQHTIQVELNRDLYMNESTKQLKKEALSEMQKRIGSALKLIQDQLAELAG